jgi:hypothetical protein
MTMLIKPSDVPTTISSYEAYVNDTTNYNVVTKSLGDANLDHM